MAGPSCFQFTKPFSLAFFIFFLTGCATTYTSLKEGTDRKTSVELFVGDEAIIIDAIYRGIRQEFPTDNIQNTGPYDKGFTWYHQPLLDRTTFRLSVKKGTGTDANNNSVTGHYYTIDTTGTQGLVEARYVAPVNAAIRGTLRASGVSTVRLASVTEVSVTQESVEAQTKTKNCFEALADDAALQPIKDKVALSGVVNQTFSMMADNSKPTPEDKIVILAWGKKRDTCIKENRLALEKQMTNPAIKNVLTSSVSASQLMIVDLYNSNITYAELAKKRQDLMNLSNEAIANIQAELQKQTEEAKARADQLALQAQQNMLLFQQTLNQTQMINQQQQIINQQRQQQITPQRLQTNCYISGTNMTCY